MLEIKSLNNLISQNKYFNKKMKKHLFISSFLALIFFAFSCEQMKLPGFRKNNRKHMGSLFSQNDAGYFKRHFVNHMTMKALEENWESKYESTNFDPNICIAVNPSKDSTTTMSVAKIILGKFESGALKEAYITKNAYFFNESKDSTQKVFWNVHIKNKLDKDNFIQNVLNPYYESFEVLTPITNYTIKINSTHELVNGGTFPYEGMIVGTVLSTSEENTFKEWVKNTGSKIIEIGNGYAPSRF